MKRLKEELIERMSTIVNKLNSSFLTEKQRILYSKELEVLTKTYATLEGNNVTLQNRKLT